MKKNTPGNRATHLLTKHPLYSRWGDMKRRCYNPNRDGYKNYGGKGIFVCDEWKNNFVAFYDWAQSSGFKEELILDRIDVNGNYEPSNCRWATQLTSDCNTSKTNYVDYKGEKICLYLLCLRLNLPYKTIWARIKNYGFTVELAVSKPIRKWKR